MDRSYRGLGLVLLVLLVVAPLCLFAVLALFEDEAEDSIRLSLDGVSWSARLDETLLASQEPWTPGQERSAIVYVENSGPAPVDADLTVTVRSSDDLVRDGFLALAATVDDGTAVPFDVAATTNEIRVEGLGSGESLPVTVTATFAGTAPIGSTLDSQTLRFRLGVTGSRTEESGAPSLLDAAGAQLWLAPVLLVVGAAVALGSQARRRSRSARLRR
jgi:hypothetical protein